MRGRHRKWEARQAFRGGAPQPQAAPERSNNQSQEEQAPAPPAALLTARPRCHLVQRRLVEQRRALLVVHSDLGQEGQARARGRMRTRRGAASKRGPTPASRCHRGGDTPQPCIWGAPGPRPAAPPLSTAHALPPPAWPAGQPHRTPSCLPRPSQARTPGVWVGVWCVGWVGGWVGGQEMSGARRVGGTGGCHGPRPRPVPAASLCPPAGPRVPLQPRHRPHLRLRQHELLQHRRRLWGEVQGAGGLHLEAGHVAQVGKGARRLLLAQKGGWRGTAGEGVAGSRRCNSGTSTHRCAV